MKLLYIIYASISFLAKSTQLFILISNSFFSSVISFSVLFFGIEMESPQTNAHFENGLVIKKESHDLS